MNRSLDVDAVRAFIRIVETGSFTRTAESMGTTQSAISLKLKRLEDRLGCKLVRRTPRYVELSAEGASFIDGARELVSVHDRAFAAIRSPKQSLMIGISDHVAGPDLPSLIARMNEGDPYLVIDIRIGSSLDLLQAFDRRELDVAIVRFQGSRSDGDIIAEEKFGWFAAPGWRHQPGEPLPVATMPEPCGVKTLASTLLDEAGVPWKEVFVGGGVAAVSAAVTAKLGVAAMARRMLPFGTIEVGPKLNLPGLPRLPIILHSHIRSGRRMKVIKELSAAFKVAARG